MILICVASAFLAFFTAPMDAVIPEAARLETPAAEYAIADHAQHACRKIRRKRIVGKTCHGNVVPGWAV
jgi:hypothetical protein